MTLVRGFTDEIKMLTGNASLGAVEGETLNITLNRIGSFAQSPMSLSASFPAADANLNIGSSLVTSGDGASRSVPSLDDIVPSPTSVTTINFQTGTITGQTVLVGGSTFTLPTGTVGQYRRCALILRSNGNIDTTFSAEAVSVAALTNPGTLLATLTLSSSGMPIGWIDLKCDNVSGKYRTAGSTSSIIENTYIYRFGSGGGGGGGVSTANFNIEQTARMTADSSLQTSLNTETSNRLSADSSLQSNLNSEVTARMTADSSLQSNLNSETSSRLTSDSTLTANLNSEISSRTSSDNLEITARSNADLTLQANINSEITSRMTADSSLQTNLNSEVTSRTNADLTLQANIDSETSSRLASDSTLTTNLNSEISSRTSSDNLEITARSNADLTLQANINSEASARMIEDSSLQSQINGLGSMSSLNSEITARTNADLTLQANIDSEATSRINSDSTLTANLNSEITSRSNADLTLQANINSEVSSRLASDSTLTTNLNSEITARMSADSSLQTNLNSEITSRSNADLTLQTNINSEATSRTTADSSLQTNLNTEATSRMTADSSLQTNLNTEATSRMTADSSLQTNLNTEATSRMTADSSLQTNINIETTARLNADSTLMSLITTNNILESLKIQFEDSTYSLLTPVVFKYDVSTFIDGSSTNVAYSGTTKALTFSAIGGTYVSTNLLDTNEFLNVTTSQIQDVSQADVQVYWQSGAIDTAATYYLSRDGGSNYTTITMTQNGYGTGSYYGTLTFPTEGSYSSLVSQATGSSTLVLNATTVQSIGQSFVLASASTLTSQTLYITVTGSPLGNLYVSWVKVSAGLPSTASADILATSTAISASSLSTGTLTVSMPATPLPAATYCMVITADATYKAQYVSSGASVGFTYNNTGLSGAAQYNGTTWTSVATSSLKYIVTGRPLDLRLKVVSSATSVSLDGFGLFYAPVTGNIISTRKKIQTFVFNSLTDNLSTFTLTAFAPDKDILKVFWIEAGLCLIYPGFQLSGYNIVFPANTFYNAAGLTVTLIAQQTEGCSFDTSDSNGMLLTENALGSSNASLDRSVAGRGILIRNASGLLRQLYLDANDNIVIASYP